MSVNVSGISPRESKSSGISREHHAMVESTIDELYHSIRSNQSDHSTAIAVIRGLADDVGSVEWMHGLSSTYVKRVFVILGHGDSLPSNWKKKEGVMLARRMIHDFVVGGTGVLADDVSDRKEDDHVNDFASGVADSDGDVDDDGDDNVCSVPVGLSLTSESINDVRRSPRKSVSFGRIQRDAVAKRNAVAQQKVNLQKILDELQTMTQ